MENGICEKYKHQLSWEGLCDQPTWTARLGWRKIQTVGHMMDVSPGMVNKKGNLNEGKVWEDNRIVFGDF